MAYSKSQVRNRRSKNVTSSEHQMVVKMALQCLRELTKAEYELPKFDQPIRVFTKCKGQRSTGGSDGITIDIRAFRKGDIFIQEYDAYKKCKIIGAAKTDHPETALFATVAHEVAHYVQYRYLPNSRLKNVYRKSHGEGFKTIYGYLRRSLINAKVEPMSENDWSIYTS